MAESLAKMALMITSNMDGLTAGLAKGQKDVAGFIKQSTETLKSGASSWGSALKDMIPGVGTLEGLGTVAGIGAFIKSTADEYKTLAREADRLQVGVEVLESYSIAAKKAGLDVGALGSAIDKMQRVISEAEGGDKAAIDKLAFLQLKPADLMGKGTEEQFETIVRRVESIGDRANRTRAQMDLFGESGAKLELAFERIAAGKTGLTLPANAIQDYARLATEAGRISSMFEYAAKRVGALAAIPLGPLFKLTADLMAPDLDKWGDYSVPSATVGAQRMNLLQDEIAGAHFRALELRAAMARGDTQGLQDMLGLKSDMSELDKLDALRTKIDALNDAHAALQSEPPSAGRDSRLAKLTEDADAAKVALEKLPQAWLTAYQAEKKSTDGMLQGMRDQLNNIPPHIQAIRKIADDAKNLSPEEKSSFMSEALRLASAIDEQKKAADEKKRAEDAVAEAVKAQRTEEEKFVAATKLAHDWAEKRFINAEGEAKLIAKAQGDLQAHWQKQRDSSKAPDLAEKDSGEAHRLLADSQAGLLMKRDQEAWFAKEQERQKIEQAKENKQAAAKVADKTEPAAKQVSLLESISAFVQDTNRLLEQIRDKDAADDFDVVDAGGF